MIPKSLNNSLFTTDLKGIKQHMNGTSTLRAFEITNKIYYQDIWNFMD